MNKIIIINTLRKDFQQANFRDAWLNANVVADKVHKQETAQLSDKSTQTIYTTIQ